MRRANLVRALDAHLLALVLEWLPVPSQLRARCACRGLWHAWALVSEVTVVVGPTPAANELALFRILRRNAGGAGRACRVRALRVVSSLQVHDVYVSAEHEGEEGEAAAASAVGWQLPRLSDDDMQRIFEFANFTDSASLRKLSFEGLAWSAAALGALFTQPALAHLEELHIDGECFEVEPVRRRSRLALRRLCLRHLGGVGDGTIAAIVSGNGADSRCRLEELDLQHLPALSKPSLGPLPRLQSLVMPHNVNFRGFLSFQAASLRVADFSSTGVGSSAISYLVTHCPELQELLLVDCRNLTSFEHVAHMSLRIVDLRFSHVRVVSVKDFAKLERLELFGCSRLRKTRVRRVPCLMNRAEVDLFVQGGDGTHLGQV